VSCRLAVKIVPRAARTEIAGWLGDRLRVRVAAVPEGGRANAELTTFLARLLGVTRTQVRIVSGHTAALKLVAVDSIDAATLAARLPPRG